LLKVKSNNMLERFLLYIKKNIGLLWKLIEITNLLIIKLFYFRKYKQLNNQFFDYRMIDEFRYRLLRKDDVEKLHDFFLTMDKDYLKYFNPHGWDKKSLSKIINNSSFITLGFYKKDELIGYFFLRLFCNKRAFIGRLVSERYKGKGIAKKMAKILYHISNLVDFNVYSTISKDNTASLRSHLSVKEYTVVKELPNNYLLIKFDNSETSI